MKTNTNTNTLLIIDPQNDFMDLENSALPVKGAVEDMQKIIKKMESVNFDSIIVTLDSHFEYDIAHPFFWKSKDGSHPKPFTIITKKDLIEEKWFPVDESQIMHCINYLDQLNVSGKYSLIIWPPHCIINSWGHKVYAELKEELKLWESKQNKKVKYFDKGKNPLTEHYSAIKAEVVLKTDNKTDTNTELMNNLLNSKNIYVAGEAFTHCVYSTVRDIALIVNSQDKYKPNIFIYENATSPVGGFEDKVEIIKKELEDLGVVFKII